MFDNAAVESRPPKRSGRPVPRLERAPGLAAPGLYRPPPAPVPIVAWASWAWRPGLLLGWRKENEGWSCHIRFRVGREDIEQFVVFDPALILPVTIEDGASWWLPAVPMSRPGSSWGGHPG